VECGTSTQEEMRRVSSFFSRNSPSYWKRDQFKTISKSSFLNQSTESIKEPLSKQADGSLGSFEKFAVIRVDTHGNRFIVEQFMSRLEAKRLEADFDRLTHHQGYYVVSQKDVEMELKR
jgi:hypothetical protein